MSRQRPAPFGSIYIIRMSRAAALSKLCLAVFNLSEFVYVD